MTDASTSRQAAEPDRDLISAEQAQVQAPVSPGGSAQLDAHITASENIDPEHDAFSDPIATNFSSATGAANQTDDAVTLSSPMHQVQSSAAENGTVHLQTNADQPDEPVQGILPDTNPATLPLDPDTNLPD